MGSGLGGLPVKSKAPFGKVLWLAPSPFRTYGIGEAAKHVKVSTFEKRREVMATEKDILDLLASLRRQRLEAQETLAAVESDLSGAERTLSLIKAMKGKPELPQSTVNASLLRGMTQMEALRTIASHNGGVVAVSEAKRLLIESGLAKGKHVSQSIYAQILRSKEFEWAAPGRYRLLASKPPLNGQQPNTSNKEGVQHGVPTDGH